MRSPALLSSPRSLTYTEARFLYCLRTTAMMPASCLAGVSCVLLSVTLGLDSISLYRLPTRTMKNSSVLEVKIDKNLHLSNSGLVTSSAWSSTLLLNSSHEYSLFT